MDHDVQHYLWYAWWCHVLSMASSQPLPGTHRSQNQGGKRVWFELFTVPSRKLRFLFFKIGLFPQNESSQPSIFRCYVSFKECIQWKETSDLPFLNEMMMKHVCFNSDLLTPRSAWCVRRRTKGWWFHPFAKLDARFFFYIDLSMPKEFLSTTVY